jgi:hypothetical protein
VASSELFKSLNCLIILADIITIITYRGQQPGGYLQGQCNNVTNSHVKKGHIIKAQRTAILPKT